MNKYSVIGVGDVEYDSLFIVENYPLEDSSTHILEMVNQGGGCVGSALVGISRLGESAGFIGNIGDDDAGKYIINDFIKEKVGIEGIEIIKNGRSSLGYVMIDPNKNTRTKFPFKDTLKDISWNDEKINLIKNTKILHIDGTKYNNAIEACKIAKENNVLISLDGCSKKKDNSLNISIAKFADILIMNANYPFYTSGLDNLEDAMKFFNSLGPKIVISTLGDKGCVALIDNKLEYFPIYKVNTVDTTGAGDAFHAGFIKATLNNYSLKDAIKYASAVSAYKCQSMGGRSGLPTHNQVIDFINHY